MGTNNVQSANEDKEVADVFERVKDTRKKTDMAYCKACKNTPKAYSRTWNTSELRKHLVRCDHYQDLQRIRQQRTTAVEQREQIERKRTQTKLDFGAPIFNIQALHGLFAKAVYTS
jgi:hypothetical protein